VVLFQLAIAFADFLSNDEKRQSDALAFFVVARAELTEKEYGSGSTRGFK
jgi:hypothetical protein